MPYFPLWLSHCTFHARTRLTWVRRVWSRLVLPNPFQAVKLLAFIYGVIPFIIRTPLWMSSGQNFTCRNRTSKMYTIGIDSKYLNPRNLDHFSKNPSIFYLHHLYGFAFMLGVISLFFRRVIFTPLMCCFNFNSRFGSDVGSK